MKEKILLVLLMFSSNLFAQTAGWDWAQSFGVLSFHEYCNSIGTDHNGNSYITGTFQDTLIIGSDTLANTGGYNSILYLAKLDSSGNPIWAICPTGNNMSEANDLSVDGDGSVYLTGAYRGTMTFGSVTLGGIGGWGRTFTIKFNSNGNALWGQTSSANHENEGFGIDVNSNNEVYITGVFDSSVVFSGNQLNGTFLGSNIFVVKYSSVGNLIWAKGITSGINTKATGITCDDFGNICITGSYRNSITFDNITLTGSSNGAGAVYIVKFDSNGNVLWAKSSGGFPTSAFGESISNDASGNFYVAGYFNSAIAIFNIDTINNAGINDLFLVKYDSLGDLQYVIGEGGTDFDQANYVRADANGNCYVTGFFKGTISFGSNYLYGPNQELFIAKFDTYGVLVWAKSATGNLNEVGYGIGIDGFNNVYIGGSFSSPTTSFGPYSITNTDPWTGSYDFFVAKLSEQSTATNDLHVSSDEINIYPNPSNGIFKINSEIQKNTTIQIRNIEGKLLREFNSNDYLIFDIRELEEGVYFLQLNSENKIVTEKIVLLK